MTSIANIAGGDMTCALAAGNDAIMTINTGANDLRMIHRNGCNRCPGRREFLMTGITYITAGYVHRALAAGCGPVVTSNTITYKCRMVHRYNGRPGIGAMATVTLCSRENVRR